MTALRRCTGSRRAEHRQGRLGELKVSTSVVPPEGETVLDVMLDVIDGGIEVAGTVRAPWKGECRRCLRPVLGEVRAEVREIYRPRRGGERDTDDEETYPLGADFLDLAPMARDAILLALPLAPLCRQDCPGLCPACGTDLSVDRCRCEQAVPAGPWAALDVLPQVPGEGSDPGA